MRVSPQGEALACQARLGGFDPRHPLRRDSLERWEASNCLRQRSPKAGGASLRCWTVMVRIHSLTLMHGAMAGALFRPAYPKGRGVSRFLSCTPSPKGREGSNPRSHYLGRTAAFSTASRAFAKAPSSLASKAFFRSSIYF